MDILTHKDVRFAGIPGIEIKKMSEFTDQGTPNVSFVRDIYMNTHEKAIKEVLSQILDREPVIEDARRLTILKHRDYPNQYGLSFDGVVLGMVRETESDHDPMSRSVNFSLTFYPGEIQFTRHAPKLR